jgi:hypothetical protein
MALLSSRGISTPSLQARGEQRRFFYFNNDRDIPGLWTAMIFSSVRITYFIMGRADTYGDAYKDAALKMLTHLQFS